MGRTPLTLSRAAETALRAAMVSAKPLVVRSRLSEADALVLVDEWELHVARDATVYQMADGKGKQSLAAMWASPMRLEHDLQDTATPNPVVAWLDAHRRQTVLVIESGSFSSALRLLRPPMALYCAGLPLLQG